MAKIFKGKIVILRGKTNSGIILLKDGSETQSIKFPSIFTDRDEVEVSFIDDNPDRDIESMTLNSKRKYYGFVRYYNKEYNDGEIVGTYPAAMSDIKFSLEDSPKLLNVISKNIKAWVARIEKIIKEFEKIIITNNNKRKNTEDRQKLKSLIKENSTVEKMISSLTEYLIKLKNQIDSEFYYEADRELIGILALLKKKNNDFKNIKNIPATKEILMKIIELNKLSQFSDITLGTNVTFKIIKTIDSEHIRAKDIGIIESKSEDNPKIKSPSYGRIIKKHDKHYWTNINKNMTIEVGQSFEAKVTASKEFGVFIETIFGHKGLIRNSELLLDKKTYSVKKPKLGEKIKVKLIYIKKDGKFDFSIKRLNYEPRGIDIKWILLTEESFKNFVSIDSTDIYYYYDIDGVFEIYKLNVNNIVELISCYTQYYTPIDIKYQIIDNLIHMDLDIKKLKRDVLIKDKIDLLKTLIDTTDDVQYKKEFVYELMRIDYDYENLKVITKKQEENLDTENIIIPNRYHTNNSINNILDKKKLKNNDLLLLKSYNTKNSIKELL